MTYYSSNKSFVDSEFDNNPKRMLVLILKRLFDLVGSIAILFAVAPFMLVVALIVYLRDPGPVFFAHQRVGKDGKTFGCLKFRTMICNADAALARILEEDPDAREEWETRQKLTKDPRILPTLGHALRRTSLDELPQLFNVLRGDMSLIGPRPCTEAELNQHYGTNAFYYMSVRPGISGLWQVSGRSRTTFEQRVQMDVHYVKNLSLGLDFWITAKTPVAVLSSDGAC